MTCEPGKIILNGDVGDIEAKIDCPQSLADTIVIIAHPHPVYGGSMDNKVVHTIARACNLSGFIALRFNFRGVGASVGEFDNGIGEQADLLTVINYAKQKNPDKKIALAGFSFGAAMCIAQINNDNFEFLLTVAPPIYKNIENIKLIDSKWGLFMGDADEVVAINTVKSWLQTQENQPEEFWFDKAGHFFHGRLPDLRDNVMRFIQDYSK